MSGLLLMLVAPLTVAVTLLWAHSVWLTFAVYHLGVCLLAPAVMARADGTRGLRAHLADIGVLTRPGRRFRRGLRSGLLCGVLMGTGTLVAFNLAGDTLLRRADLAGVLAQWGVGPGQLPQLFAVMLLGNAFAEELFWRGWVHGRFASWPARGTAIGITAALYTSYHMLTAALLTRSATATALFTVAVFGAGCIWGWLREKHGTVWPAVLGHAGATAGYMAVLAARL